MIVISLLNPKGGSGKTTIATNLASSFHRQGKRVLLVDSDPQGSARDWHAVRDDNPITLVALDRPNNLKNLANVTQNYDLVLVDGAAKLEDMIAAAIKVSDIVLIPVQPSPYDIWAASDLVDLITTRQEVMEGKPKAAFIISRAVTNTKLGGEVSTAVREYGLPVFQSGTIQRQVYPRTASEGFTVFDADNKQAIDEINAIASEIVAFNENNLAKAHANVVNI